jgi:hypothetical protein
MRHNLPAVRLAGSHDRLTPGYWRKGAEEMRSLAEDLRDPELKAMLLRIADGFELRAKRAEER